MKNNTIMKILAVALVIVVVLIVVVVVNDRGSEVVRDVDVSEVIPDKTTEKPADNNDTQEVVPDTPDEVIEKPAEVIGNSNLVDDGYVITDSMEEPPFPTATPATEWRMFRRTPDNMGLISADIPTPLGKELSSGGQPEYRFISFAAPAANYIYGSPAVVNNELFFGVKLGYLQVHNFTTGSYRWRLMDPIKGSITTSIAADNEKIYFGTAGGGAMFAYRQFGDDELPNDIDDEEDAEEVRKIIKSTWKFQTGNNISAPPGTTNENFKNPVIMSSPKIIGKRLYFGAFDGKMYCLNTDNGEKIWDYATGSKVYSSPAIASGRLYFTNFEGKVFCLNVETGEKIWETKLPKAIIGSPVVFGPRIWIGCKNAKMYCLKAFDGEILWDFQAPDSDFGIEACPAIDEKYCYFGDSSGHFTCLDRKTGEKIWQVKVSTENKPVNSSPLVTADKIFVGSHDKSLYVLDKKDGKTLDSFPTTGSILASPIIIGNEILAPSYDSYIYILRGRGVAPPE